SQSTRFRQSELDPARSGQTTELAATSFDCPTNRRNRLGVGRRSRAVAGGAQTQQSTELRQVRGRAAARDTAQPNVARSLTAARGRGAPAAAPRPPRPPPPPRRPRPPPLPPPPPRCPARRPRVGPIGSSPYPASPRPSCRFSRRHRPPQRLPPRARRRSRPKRS